MKQYVTEYDVRRPNHDPQDSLHFRYKSDKKPFVKKGILHISKNIAFNLSQIAHWECEEIEL